MSFHEKFNQTFSEFLEDIIRVFPTDPDYRMYQVAMQTALLLDPTRVQKVFHEKVANAYGDKILARDESFFLSHSFEEASNSDKATKMIEKIKSSYVKMNKQDQEITWKYFRILVLLDRKINRSS